MLLCCFVCLLFVLIPIRKCSTNHINNNTLVVTIVVVVVVVVVVFVVVFVAICKRFKNGFDLVEYSEFAPNSTFKTTTTNNKNNKQTKNQ
jgi:predicted PurR-regulated permease PerM